MDSRLILHEELCNTLGTRNVYYNPPESLKLNYPCIVYNRSGINKLNANDRIYKKMNRYSLTVIDPDPDSDIPDRLIERFEYCSYDTGYVANNLNHDRLTLYH